MRFMTNRESSELAYWCRVVSEMKPGECLDIDRFDLMDIPSFEHNEATFTPPDRILGNIIGSAYTHSYRISGDGQKVTFTRHENSGQRRHSDPDDEYRLRMIKERQQYR